MCSTVSVTIPANVANATDASLPENNVSLDGLLQFKNSGILSYNNSC